MRRLVTLVVAVASLAACGVDSNQAMLGPESPLAYTQRARLAAVDLVQFAGGVGRIATLVERPGDPSLYVVNQSGLVWRIPRPTADDPTVTEMITDGNELYETAALDIVDQTDSRGEEGLVGLAFDPTGEFAYVNQSRLEDGHSWIAEYRVLDDGSFDVDSRRELFLIEQGSLNHNGGQLLFGPDGYLYLGVGDGSSRSDLDRTALDLTLPLGKILRIDPRPADGADYAVPADNPLVPFGSADKRIWSWGLRNPFSFSFDSATGDLWIADVGQRKVEEINYAPATNGRDAGKGLNFGWSAFEGVARFNDDQPTNDHTEPWITYSHDLPDICAVIDGTMVRASQVPALDDWYVYGDWCSGMIWGHDPFERNAEPFVLGTVPGFTQMLQTEDGNLYVASHFGEVHLVVEA